MEMSDHGVVDFRTQIIAASVRNPSQDVNPSYRFQSDAFWRDD
jgi:hypothetical protein